MWTTNGWFGFSREQIATLQEGTLYEATDEKSAREAAQRFSSRPENGNTISVKVKNTKTGEISHHHVYQRDHSKADETKRLVTVRPVGKFTTASEKHNEVIKNYLAGKRAPKE